MRKDLLALGISILFLGLVSVVYSRVVIKPQPKQNWVLVEETWAQPLNMSLFVQGDLEEEDRFRVYFRITPAGVFKIPDVVIRVNITDPNENTKSYYVNVPFQQGAPNPEFSEYAANFTGTYRVTTQTILPTVQFSYLALQKLEIEEGDPQYPNSDFLPVGVVVLLGGFGILLLGVRLAKPKRTLYKRRLLKRKTSS